MDQLATGHVLTNQKKWTMNFMSFCQQKNDDKKMEQFATQSEAMKLS